ncbi:thioredoxin domain-containing protein [Paenibacillus campi]|uniref:thioredoxin domain-containing protein n=1 Tax=Paenibacillus campi TaxID=3106031 RepID=UPI002AFF69AC|nr:thioredoxin domain-containing protein [Paenibacillus sp. SGZ-1014]
MERESFEDEDVAALLNEHFVPVKVDREERPDIDHLYMAYCQALTGQGGWPLTVLLTPEQKPFYAGTYFPKQTKYGRIGMIDMLGQIHNKWTHERERIVEAGDAIVQRMNEFKAEGEPGGFDESIVHRAYQTLASSFDEHYGGFGAAPKFPTPHHLMFLSAYAYTYDQPQALDMVRTTLERMYRGGMYDHIGFGFARYSTDEQWLVPHFEKMLYDNALLAIAYVDAYSLTEDEQYARIAESIFTYVLRDMTSPEGAFYSAEDADSEGVEGKFYLFDRYEIEDVLGLEAMHTYCNVYDITPEGNFEGENIPNLIARTIAEIAEERDLNELALRTDLEEYRQKLFDYREQRVHPFKDDKVLVSWNGMMIAALAHAGKRLQQPQYTQAAERAVDFIWQTMFRQDGRLMSRYRDGHVAFPAYVDDYAYLMWGLLELYEATGNSLYLEHATALKAQLLALFWDDEQHGFYFSGAEGDPLISRTKEIYDGAIPSGNSVAAWVLARLAAMTNDDELRAYAERILDAFIGTVQQYPAGYSMLMLAGMQLLNGTEEIVVTGKAEDIGYQQMLAEVQKTYRPFAALLFNESGAAGEPIRHLLPHLHDKLSNGDAMTYICEGFVCHAPLTTMEAVTEALQPRRS